MTAILKLGDAAVVNLVRPLHQMKSDQLAQSNEILTDVPTGPVEEISAKAPPSAEAFEAVAAENEKLVLALEQARDEIEKTRKSATEAGRKEGLSEAVEGSESKFKLLRKNAEQALTKFNDQIASIDGLAVLLARNALAKIIGEDGNMTALVTQTIRQHLQSVESQSELTITVSAKDFPDEFALNTLSEGLGSPELAFAADGSLESGGCLIKMRLGGIDIGVPGQLAKLDTVLREMAGLAE